MKVNEYFGKAPIVVHNGVEKYPMHCPISGYKHVHKFDEANAIMEGSRATIIWHGFNFKPNFMYLYWTENWY